jgi:hypothetical protein
VSEKQPIERLADEDAHEELYELLVGAAAETPVVNAADETEQEEAA